MAEKALEEKTGARGLATVLESTLREFKFYLPGSPVKRLAVTRELVERPADVLKRLEDEPDYGNRPFLEASVREYEETFHQAHEIRIHFDDEAVEETIARSEAEGVKIAAYLDEALMDYVYGLRIIRDHTGKREFTLIGEKHPESPKRTGWLGKGRPEQRNEGLIRILDSPNSVPLDADALTADALTADALTAERS